MMSGDYVGLTVITAVILFALLGVIVKTWHKRAMKRTERRAVSPDRDRAVIIENGVRTGKPVVLGDRPSPPKSPPSEPPPGFIRVPNDTMAGRIILFNDEKVFAAEVVHQIREGTYVTWAKLRPVPLPRRALDRLLSDDEVL
jgi:hypothetical protein